MSLITLVKSEVGPIEKRKLKVVTSDSNKRSTVNLLCSVALSLILIMHNSGCTYVNSNRASLDDLAQQEITALALYPESACHAAIADIEGCPNNRRCPDAVYTAAKCQLEGLGGTTVDLTRGMKLLNFAAGCGIIPAKDELTRLGLPVPDQIISYGYRILPPSTEEQKMCGVKDSVTALTLGGFVVSVPILLAAGVVLLGAAIVIGPPYCAVRWLVTDGTCLDDLASKPSGENSTL